MYRFMISGGYDVVQWFMGIIFHPMDRLFCKVRLFTYFFISIGLESSTGLYFVINIFLNQHLFDECASLLPPLASCIARLTLFENYLQSQMIYTSFYFKLWRNWLFCSKLWHFSGITIKRTKFKLLLNTRTTTYIKGNEFCLSLLN